MRNWIFRVLFDLLFWCPVRWVLQLALTRASKSIILSRNIGYSTGHKSRWLKSDFKSFRKRFSATTNDLRSVAGLELLPNVGSKLMVELTIFTIAAYRTFIDIGVPEPDAQELVADIGWRIYSALLTVSSLPARVSSRDPAVRLGRTIKSLLWFPFSLSASPGYNANVWSSDDAIHTHFTHCPPQTFVRGLIEKGGDRGELDAFKASWCKYDWPGADIIAGDGKRGHYQRKRTLSHGDPVCDMCWSGTAACRSSPDQGRTNNAPPPRDAIKSEADLGAAGTNSLSESGPAEGRYGK